MELQNFTIKKNKYKQKENHPDYVIGANINNNWKDVGACWVKQDKNGNSYMSCSISKPKEEKVVEDTQNDIKTEDIPF